MFFFLWRLKKTGDPGEKPLEQGENQQQTQPTYGTGPESNPGDDSGGGGMGERSHLCAIPASPPGLRLSYENIQFHVAKPADARVAYCMKMRLVYWCMHITNASY